MKLRNVEFNPCWDASGVRGFFHDGRRYWFHNLPYAKQRWFQFAGSTFTAKTSTLYEEKGRTALQGPEKDFLPKEWFPKAVWCSWLKQIALNTIALSGPGTQALLDAGLLRRSAEPFIISFMSVAKTPEDRIDEFNQFVKLLIEAKHEATAPFGIQLNRSCSNTDLGHQDATNVFVEETREYLNIAAVLGVPLIVKLNVLTPIDVAGVIADHGNCDALCITNAIPWGALREWIPWDTLFPNGSPLAKRGLPNGSLSGKYLLPVVIDWVNRAFVAGIDIPMNVGGGITHPEDVPSLVTAADLRPGIDSIFIGSMAMLCPWYIPSTIANAHRYLG